MSTNLEEIRQHVKMYVTVFVTLMVLTVVTVGVSYLRLAIPLAITIALVIAVTKGSLVARYFMHLVSEKSPIYWTLMLTAVLFLALISLPVLSMLDQTGY